MRITIICEGKTEKAFRESLRDFLSPRLQGCMPALKFDVHHGSIPTEDKLRRVVRTLLDTGTKRSDAVIGLTDVYPSFSSASDAKQKMREWVGNEQAFFPHAAQYDFEAWLLPFWDRIQQLAGRSAAPFGAHPEAVNHNNSPAHRLARLFEAGTCRDSYKKPRDAKRILSGADLLLTINECPELKAFVNTIFQLTDASQVLT